MLIGNSIQAELNARNFDAIREAVYRRIGIRFNPGKEELVRSRLIKRLRALGMGGFDEYLAYIDEDSSAQELDIMVDLLTTNKTAFFREPQHFDYLRTRILPAHIAHKTAARIWSAGCSTGEEPYSIAALIAEEWPDAVKCGVRILATDISGRVLAIARAAEYGMEALKDLPPGYLRRHFLPASAGRPCCYVVHPKVRSLVRFARLNLMDEWPMHGPFDVIFCRNVMIYFDPATRKSLVQRFWQLLSPGGRLFVGHSESLATSRQYQYVQPAIYMKQH
jgi:chemotaxis protein methyltransferase CheR